MFKRALPWRRLLRALRLQLPPLNFITIHYAYFILFCLASALIFWGSNTPGRGTANVSFTDCLFLTISAMTEAGLNTINLSELNTFQQFILFTLIMLGSAIWVSSFVVLVRKRIFEKRFEEVIREQRERSSARRGRSGSANRSLSQIRTWTSRGRSEAPPPQLQPHRDPEAAKEEAVKQAGEDEVVRDRHDRDLTPPARRGGPEMNSVSQDIDTEERPRATPGITFAGDTNFTHPRPAQPVRRRGISLFTMQGVGARPDTTLVSPTSPTRCSTTPYSQFSDVNALPAPPKSRGDISQYFESVSGWISRNSQFHGLSEKERERLGGCEYRAVAFLAYLVPVYFLLWQLIGCIACAAWVRLNAQDTARSNGLNPWWVGAFNAVSAFNNSGMSLLDANMTAFQRSYYLLITMSLLILAGNTMYPVFLRAIVWTMWKCIEQGGPVASRLRFSGPEWEERAMTLRFLLDHPRRCYTNLFPSQHTWWLMWSVILLNGVDWAAFEILNINNHRLSDGLPTRYRAIDGLFQAFAVRSGGFYVVAIPSLRISLQVLYVVMMYISVYPVVITMRNSNVYEERSLGIYAEDQPQEEEDDDDDKKDSEAQVSGSDEKKGGPGGMLKRAKTIRDHLVAAGAQRHESNRHFVRQQLRAQLAHDAWWIVLALFLIMTIENDQFQAQPTVYSVFNFIFEIVSAYGCVGISVGVPWNAYSFCGSWTTLSKLILCAVMLRGRHRGLPVAIDKAVLLPGEANWVAEEEDGVRRLGISRTMTMGISRDRDGVV